MNEYVTPHIEIGKRVQVDISNENENSLLRKVVLEQGEPVGIVIRNDGVFTWIEWSAGCTFGGCFHMHSLRVLS